MIQPSFLFWYTIWNLYLTPINLMPNILGLEVQCQEERPFSYQKLSDIVSQQNDISITWSTHFVHVPCIVFAMSQEIVTSKKY